MVRRHPKLSKSNSFFLFGPRGSGKTTLIKERYQSENNLFIDLLDEKMESRYWSDPDLLFNDVSRIKKGWVIIDEVQKIPKLLDIVHKSIEAYKTKFILTGSSSRKLKRGGANLLAGRAFLYHLFPLTYLELKEKFDLNFTLQWGALPKIFQFDSDKDRRDFLISYTKTYLKEEIIAEQIIRNIDGFRSFLEVAAQMNGKTLNFLKISRECGVDSKTVNSYFQILEDTLVGFWVPGFHKSIRKAQKIQPKFYFFDLGVLRALEGTLESKPISGTSVYGQYFESFVINEILRYNSYTQKDYRISHYQTSTGQEIDLILSKGTQDILIEIKSTQQIDRVEVEKFARISKGFKKSSSYFISQDKVISEIEGVRCMPWQNAIEEIFELSNFLDN